MGIGDSIRRRLGGKSWLETVRPEELEKELLRVDNQIEALGREIQRLEAKKKELFQEGIGKSNIEKMLLAEKIKDLDAEVKMKLKEYNRLMKQRRALSNLLRLKKWEDRLKEKGVWEKIKSIDPEKLMAILSEAQWEDRSFEENLDRINIMLTREFGSVEVDESTREILELWEKVENSELEPEKVEEKLSVRIGEKEGEKKEEA
ncbi:MAG: hypothetical protein LRS48_05155 [Desulfurococcales archaeon]|nr:hypothetical protein [Desulfurococcales archaeon]